MRNSLKILFIAAIWLIPSIVSPGLFTEGGIRYEVVVIEWEPFYVYPQIPAVIDHRASDVYEISMWQKYTNDTPDYALKDGNYTLGEWIPFNQNLSCGNCDFPYGQTTWIRSELREYDPGTTWRDKWGDQWAMFMVYGGYIGVLPIEVKWDMKNTRTGKSWEVFRLVQRGYISCEDYEVNGRCIGIDTGVPVMPPKAPTLIARKE